MNENMNISLYNSNFTITKINDATIIPSMNDTTIIPNMNNIHLSGICSSNKEFLSSSFRFPSKINKQLYFDELNIDNVEISLDEVIFGGYFFPHYGHMLLETLSRLWIIMTDINKINNKITKIVMITYFPNQCSYTNPMKHMLFFTLINMIICNNNNNITFEIINKPTKFKTIYTPESLFELGDSINKKIIHIYNKIKLTLPKYIKPLNDGLIYITRKGGVERIKNESQLITLMIRMNICVLSPTFESFTYDINQYMNSRVIIGIEGTNLHNTVFMNKDNDCHVINIASNRDGYVKKYGYTYNQELCNSLSMVKMHVIPFKEVIPNTNIYDIDFIEKELTEILRSLKN